MGDSITKKMLHTIREGIESNRHYTAQPVVDDVQQPKATFLSEAKALMEDASKKKEDNDTDVKNEKKYGDDGKIEIDKKTPQFGDVKSSQESTIKQAIEEDMEIKLFYYPKAKDLVLNGKISSLNIVFQFRYKDPSGDGCYIWANELQLTDTNARKIGKIRDAFLNWKTSLIKNGDLLEKLSKASEKENNKQE